MAQLTSHQTGQDTDAAIGDVAGSELRRAQSFQIPQTATITSVELYLKDGASSPTDAITVRIETDSTGPTGTLVDGAATGTIAVAGITGSFAFHACNYSAFNLLASVTYNVVASVPNQANDVNFIWGADSNQGYANGTLYTSTNGGAWGANSLDGLFIINGTVGGQNVSYAFFM